MKFKPGDRVFCQDDIGSQGALVDGSHYTVRSTYGDYVSLDGVDGEWWANRFYPAPPSPVDALIAAIDRGSWAEVLEARKAFP